MRNYNIPELRKLEGFRCSNLQDDCTCAIYATRPRTCRAFYCGWRAFKWVREPLRPDRSGVIVLARDDKQVAVTITLLEKRALVAEGLAESIAAAVAAGLVVDLHIPGPPGYTSARVRADEALRPAVLARDKPAVLAMLRKLYKSCAAVKPTPLVPAWRSVSPEAPTSP